MLTHYTNLLAIENILFEIGFKKITDTEYRKEYKLSEPNSVSEYLIIIDKHVKNPDLIDVKPEYDNGWYRILPFEIGDIISQVEKKNIDIKYFKDMLYTDDEPDIFNRNEPTSTTEETVKVKDKTKFRKTFKKIMFILLYIFIGIGVTGILYIIIEGLIENFL